MKKLTLVAIIIHSLSIVTAQWENKTDAPSKLNNNISYDITFDSLADMITARYGFAYANDGNHLYAICGGTFEPPYRVNNIERYNTGTNIWSEFVYGLIPRRYCRAEYIQSTNRLYIFGGQTYYVANPATYTDTVEVIDVTNGNITYLTSNPIPNTSTGAAVWNNKIYIFGGSQHSIYSSELYEFNPINNLWTQLQDMPEEKQTEGEVVDGVLYVFGGYNGSDVSNRIDAYNIENDEWSFIGYMPVGVSAHHTTVFEQNIWLVGNYDNLDFVAVFDAESYEFTQFNTNMIGRRHCGTEVIGNNLYAYGGNIATEGPALSSLQYADLSLTSIIDSPYKNPSSSILIQIHPNPFTTTTTIEYELNQPETVKITFFNQFGKVVDVIEEGQQKGLNKVVWTPENLADGIYYFRIDAGTNVGIAKVVLLK